ncbi:twin-arginine translocase TatA/TatE family subunit [Geodermatophilus chilensis]|uniref:twin-arginine translocase TatA/TatE family subunit n=1 Tax=Geodermatophilus chilensis TaxID=2035835 RepID=UPI000C26A5C7|nr:twin-arginine translocase TatA/TatE family subunit [Geodermatophilus chilensis]
MFSSIGWGEIVVLALAALFVFGPDRLPDLTQQAAAGLRRLRSAMTGIRGQLDQELGEDIDRLRALRQYHPRTLVREHLLADDTQSGRLG